MSNLHIKHSNYDNLPEIVDVNFIDLNIYNNILVVCAREGQKIRLNKLKKEGIHNADIVGVWDLSGRPIGLLTKYDAVYILDPERIGYPELKAQWKRIIKTWNPQQLYWSEA